MSDLTQIGSETAYGVSLGDSQNIFHSSIKIGGDTVKFVPNINASKWNDEAWFNLNPSWFSVGNEVQAFVDGKVQIGVGDVTFFAFVEKDGRLAWGLEYAKKPASNIVEFDLTHSANLSFYYQGILNPLDDPPQSISVRPDNVIGSYAVYFNTRDNKYRTGKFCHLFRPRLTDKDGNQAWASQ